MVDTCHVTGVVISPDGDPVPRATVRFQRLPHEVFVEDDRTGIPREVRAEADEEGNIAVDLIPGEYRTLIIARGYNQYPAFNVGVPDQPSAVLADIQDVPPPPPLDDATRAVRDARDARDEARGAKDGAEQARDDAQAAAGQAQDAQAAAETARDGADAARAGAEAAKGGAEALYGDLSAVQEAVTDAEGAAEAAAASLHAAQEITGGAYGVGTQPLELPRNTELGSAAYTPYEPLSLYPIVTTGATTLTPDDAGKAVWSGAHDITLPDSAAPGMEPGWRVWVKNTDGVSSITIDCGGSGDTIDGNASLSLAAGESVLIVMIATGQFGSL